MGGRAVTLPPGWQQMLPSEGRPGRRPRFAGHPRVTRSRWGAQAPAPGKQGGEPGGPPCSCTFSELEGKVIPYFDSSVTARNSGL